MKIMILLVLSLFAGVVYAASPTPKPAMVALDSQSNDITQLRERLDALENLKKDLANIKTIRSEILAHLKFERALAKVNFYTKAEVQQLLDKAQKSFRETCSELYEDVAKQLDQMQKDINLLKAQHLAQQVQIDETRQKVDQIIDRSVLVRLGVVGGAVPGTGDFYGYGAAGVSKTFEDDVVDLELVVGGTQKGSGMLVGGRGGYLHALGENLRLGGGITFLMNYGTNQAELGPDGTIEFGPQETSAFLRGFFPHVIADPDGETGWTDPSMQVGVGGRW